MQVREPAHVKRRVFRGWRLVGAGAGIQFLVGSLLFHAYGSYVVMWQREFDWSATLLGLGFSMTRVESALLGPFQGALIDRFGPRAVMRVGMVLFGTGFLLLSRIQTPVGFLVSLLVIAVGISLAGYLSICVAIVNWFHRRRSLALGLTLTGMGFGGLMAPVIATALERHGWRAVAMASGILVLVVGPLLAQVFVHRPEDVGERVDGDPEQPPEGGAPVPVVADFSVRQAMRTSAFWLLSVGHSGSLLIVSATLVHLVPHMTGAAFGLSLPEAGAIVALMTGMQILGQVVGGALGDRFHKARMSFLCLVAQSGALVLVAHGRGAGVLVLFAVVQGLAWGVRGPLMQALRADLFGRRAFGAIMGMSSLIVMLGMISGPIVAGFLHDLWGDYVAAFTGLGVLGLATSVCFALIRPPAPGADAWEPPGGGGPPPGAAAVFDDSP